ncbi:hypothetical protein [Nonomuraea basaltis]|uniref:hypothetical protein n=1 Tax=Nonomuraea basaltis TaxID=2495887 RepID=UPI00110C6D94|nr:hypothetical protein [Nonomuraea basaltis]TMR99479.1 hypothetical protein EJK15_06605 [Nonomuraea basaltis]
MIWFVMSGGACLGLGGVFAGFRKKDKLPEKAMGVFASLLLLAFSASMFLLPVGRMFVNFGAWLVELATAGSVKTVLGSVTLFMVTVAFFAMVGAVLKDCLKDSKPDRPTFVACCILWIFAGIAFGALSGPVEYDRFTADVMRETVESWGR